MVRGEAPVATSLERIRGSIPFSKMGLTWLSSLKNWWRHKWAVVAKLLLIDDFMGFYSSNLPKILRLWRYITRMGSQFWADLILDRLWSDVIRIPELNWTTFRFRHQDWLFLILEARPMGDVCQMGLCQSIYDMEFESEWVMLDACMYNKSWYVYIISTYI